MAAALGFGLMAILAKEAYAAGAGVATLLTLRFALAAAVFWVIVALRRPVRPKRRTAVAGLGLGAAGYAAQAGLFFAALTRIDASLTSLLLYTYPAIVLVTAIAIGRDHADRRRLAALALASSGAALVLLGGGTGSLDGLGVALALGAAVAYSAYILVADRVVPQIDVFLLGALVMTGALLSVGAFTIATGSLDAGFAPSGWAALVALSLVSTVMPVAAFISGLPLVGPGTASIVSTVEPVVTVTLAMAVFGERLGPVQAAGAALVLTAVVLVQAKGKVRATDAASVEIAPRPAARPLAQHAS